MILAGKVILAPMAGFTDLSFRTVCGEMGADAACCEMVSAKPLSLIHLFLESGFWKSYAAPHTPGLAGSSLPAVVKALPFSSSLVYSF